MKAFSSRLALVGGDWLDSSFRLLAPGVLLLLFCSSWLQAAEPELAQLLKAKGADFRESGGGIAQLNIPDGSRFTDQEFGRLGELKLLKNLSVSKGLNDARFAQLGALTELESLQTNVADITDEGVRPLARCTRLKTLKFFHPGKSFSGAGLVHLEKLPNLQSLTVAGSLAFNDTGMSAVAQLPGLTEFRTWHAGVTNAGVRKLSALTKLKSLYLGQRLSYEPPACPADDTLPLLLELKTLEQLQLDEARLTGKALQQLRQLSALKKLTLGGVDISREDVERLRRELPQVKVDWTEPTPAYQKRITKLFGER
jgi:hypothetical protein